MKYGTIIFDLDGTLVDTLGDIAAAANETRRAFGMPPAPIETIRGFIGNGARVLIQRVLGESLTGQVDSALEYFLRYYGEHLLEESRPYPGCIDLLAKLKERGHTLAILTNKPERLTLGLLDGLKLAPYFTAVVGGDTLPVRKPDPCGVVHLKQLTGDANERLVLVGDSLVDHRTAQAAGIDFLGVAWGFGATDLRDAGVPLLETAEALFDALS